MNVVRRSQLSGKVNSMELDITANQIAQYESGKFLIQDIFPNLTRGEREFIKSGITPEEWEENFGSFNAP